MPHMNSSGGDDLACTDEVKVYKDEGEEEEQQKSSENLREDKVGLVIEGEGQVPLDFDFLTKNGGASFLKVPFAADPRLAGYFLSPYASYTNGSHSGFGGKVPLVPSVPNPFSFMSLYDAFTQPPPAHRSPLTDPKTGLPSNPMYTIPTPPPGHQIPPLYSADLAAAAAAAAWAHSPPAASLSHGSSPGVAHPAALRGSPYAMPGGPASIASYPSAHHHMAGHFSSSMLAAAAAVAAGNHHSLHPAHVQLLNSLQGAGAVSSGSPVVSVASNSQHQHREGKSSSSSHSAFLSQSQRAHLSSSSSSSSHPHSHHHPGHLPSSHHQRESGGSRCGMLGVSGPHHHNSGIRNHFARDLSEPSKLKKHHIKKPLNAFMLFMKEMRPRVQEECTLKESAAINQILGKKWHELSREDQSKYYDLARKEKELHLQLYPNWSARDNYAVHTKRRKKRKNINDTHNHNSLTGHASSSGHSHLTGLGPHDARGDIGNPKKCRARFGLEHQNQWCKPCRRKKKCIRFISDNEDGEDGACSESSPLLNASDHCSNADTFVRPSLLQNPASQNCSTTHNSDEDDDDEEDDVDEELAFKQDDNQKFDGKEETLSENEAPSSITPMGAYPIPVNSDKHSNKDSHSNSSPFLDDPEEKENGEEQSESKNKSLLINGDSTSNPPSSRSSGLISSTIFSNEAVEKNSPHDGSASEPTDSQCRQTSSCSTDPSMSISTPPAPISEECTPLMETPPLIIKSEIQLHDEDYSPPTSTNDKRQLKSPSSSSPEAKPVHSPVPNNNNNRSSPYSQNDKFANCSDRSPSNSYSSNSELKFVLKRPWKDSLCCEKSRDSTSSPHADVKHRRTVSPESCDAKLKTAN